MKLSTFCIVALLDLPLAGQALAQTMPLEEIARRLIRNEFQGRGSIPERVTFASVQVIPKGTDNFVVNVKFTLRGYYRDSTQVHDYDGSWLLSKETGSWKIQDDSQRMSPGRSEAKSAPPPPGEIDVPVPAASAAQPDRSKQAAANGGGGAVPLGEYNCVMSAGGQLIHAGGFTLQAGGVYHDEDNGRGKFTYDSNQHQITFQGAAMSGQVGRYSGGTFTLKSERNSVDCDQ